MKIKINRNILWSETFVNELASLGVKYVSLSPGSRNTPLTFAFAKNKKIKSFIHIDERSSGFFALGLAKASGTPVAVVCTSGTATAELYPAIIEAYQQRVPLIICTADRPPELLDRGANQTINQKNIYRNHIRKFFDAGIPEPSISKISELKKTAYRAVIESTIEAKGPVHLNFPFRKPFEPDSFTDEVDKEIINFANRISGSKSECLPHNDDDITGQKWFREIVGIIKVSRRGLIIVGPENYNPKFLTSCQKLSKLLGYPVLADGTSQLRFGRHKKDNIITNYDAFLRSATFAKNHQPDIILQFGRTITSKGLDTYLENCDAPRYMINESGDWFDPACKAKGAYAYKPYLFCEKILGEIGSGNKLNDKSEWLLSFKNAEAVSLKLKRKIIDNSRFPDEGRVISEVLKAVPDDCRIMLSNSMPVRDFDYFASSTGKKIIVYNNRGASGIDGITSTALGIAAASGKPTVLITGDLAFYYDLNGLLSAKNYKIPLVIVLINNNGGGIFEILPVSSYKEVFKKYFVVPHNLTFSKFVKAYEGNYKKIRSWVDLNSTLASALKSDKFSVLEIKTGASESLKIRREFWRKVNESLD